MSKKLNQNIVNAYARGMRRAVETKRVESTGLRDGTKVLSEALGRPRTRDEIASGECLKAMAELQASIFVDGNGASEHDGEHDGETLFVAGE
jgi:hypothetical protein